MTLHRNAVLGDRHAVHNWEVADLAARDALAVVAGDKGKVCFQIDVGALWFLANHTGPVWVEVTATAVFGLPPGGTTGQILAKASDADYDVEWIDAPIGEEEMAESSGTFNPTMFASTGDVEASYSDQAGNYHRIGNRVFYNIKLRGDLFGQAGSVYVSLSDLAMRLTTLGDLPLHDAVILARHEIELTSVKNGEHFSAYLAQSAVGADPRIYIVLNNGSGVFNVDAADLTDDLIVEMSGSYQAVPL
jgi:hypothetical protein